MLVGPGAGGAATTELTGGEAFSRVTSKPGKGSIASTFELTAPPASEACREPGMSIGPCANTADGPITWAFWLGVELPPGHLEAVRSPELADAGADRPQRPVRGDGVGGGSLRAARHGQRRFR